jgi:phosphoesterase RecJ-like protein
MYRKLLKYIKKYDTIILNRHESGDPDALGAQAGLRALINKNFPKKKVYLAGENAERLIYIAKMDNIPDEAFKGALAIVLDTPNANRVDDQRFKEADFIIRVDHHPSVEEFANFEIVDSNASSTCQLIIEFAYANKLKLSKEVGEKLFLGLVADTNRFMYEHTTPKTFSLAARLIEDTKIDINALYDKLYYRPLEELRLQGYIAENLTVTEEGLAYIIIPDKILEKLNVDSGAPTNMINKFNNVDKYLVWIFIVEDKAKNRYRVSVRSRGPIIKEILEKHHGGGHKYACGARLPLDYDYEKLLDDLKILCKNYKEKED